MKHKDEIVSLLGQAIGDLLEQDNAALEPILDKVRKAKDLMQEGQPIRVRLNTWVIQTSDVPMPLISMCAEDELKNVGCIGSYDDPVLGTTVYLVKSMPQDHKSMGVQWVVEEPYALGVVS